MLPALLLALGCAGTPSSPAPPDASPSWARLELGDVAVGLEERRSQATSEGRVVWRQRTYALEEGRVVTSRAELARDGSLRALTVVDAQGSRSWRAGAEPVWLLDVAAPERIGPVAALDPSTLEVTPGHVHADGFTVGSIRWTRDGPDLVAGALAWRAVDRRPELRPVDPVALLRRPVEGIDGDRARRSVHARFLVDGVEVEIRAPLALELPADVRRRLVASVDRVRRSIRWRARPGPADGLAALARGWGDCKDQADAWVRLAREDGIEARPRSGLVFLDGPDGPGLVPHAWAEARVDGRWVAVDPTLGQVPADATHLPLDPLRLLSAEVELRAVR